MKEVWNAFICLCKHLYAYFLKFLCTWWKLLNFIYHQTWNFRGCSNPAQRQCKPVETTFPLSSHSRVLPVSTSPAMMLAFETACLAGSQLSIFLPADSASPVAAFASWKLLYQCSTSKPSGKESSFTTSPPLVSALSWRCGTCAVWEDLAFLNALFLTYEALIGKLPAGCGHHLSQWKKHCFSLITSIPNVRMHFIPGHQTWTPLCNKNTLVSVTNRFDFIIFSLGPFPHYVSAKADPHSDFWGERNRWKTASEEVKLWPYI